MSDAGPRTLLFLCIYREKHEKNLLVKNHWEDLEIIWHKWSLGDQGLHTLEKYLNLEGFLEKSLKIR